jgi:hypothetical protein
VWSHDALPVGGHAGVRESVHFVTLSHLHYFVREGVCVCERECMCERERERVCVWEGVCVCERERERERDW